MTDTDSAPAPAHPTGTRAAAERQDRGRFLRWARHPHYELIDCGLHGHHLVGTDAATIRPDDALIVREHDDLRWHRCLRCDAWLPLPVPSDPGRDHVPDRDQIELPLRGRALRDRYILRLIALDRLVHFLVLAVLAVGVLLFAVDRPALSAPFYRVLDATQGTVGPDGGGSSGLLEKLSRAFAVTSGTLWLIAATVGAYALLEGIEAIGLWRGRRWAEYLTFVATAVLLIPEIYELTHAITPTKIVALVVNVAVVVYLLVAKRLFGLRGGAVAVERERNRDSGWPALERVLPAPGR